MAANITDEEPSSYPIFNEKTNIKDSIFELEMYFCSGNSLRGRHAIVQRKFWSFDEMIRYNCKGEGCKWKIHASPMQDTKTY